jgi:hypothetical protein
MEPEPEDDPEFVPLPEAPYPFEAFQAHFAAMPTVRNYTHVRNHYGPNAFEAFVGDRQGFEETSFRVIDYFAQQYSDRREIGIKAMRFMRAMSWVADHADTIMANDPAGRLARRLPTDPPGIFEISSALLRALHDEFIVARLIRPEPPLAEVVARATKYADDEEAGRL